MTVVGVKEDDNYMKVMFILSVGDSRRNEFLYISPLVLQPYWKFDIIKKMTIPDILTCSRTGLKYNRMLKCETPYVYRHHSPVFNVSSVDQIEIESEHQLFIMEYSDIVNGYIHVPSEYHTSNSDNPYFHDIDEREYNKVCLYLEDGTICKKVFANNLKLHIGNEIPKSTLKGKILFVFFKWNDVYSAAQFSSVIQENFTADQFFSFYGEDYAIVEKDYDKRLYLIKIKLLSTICI